MYIIKNHIHFCAVYVYMYKNIYQYMCTWIKHALNTATLAAPNSSMTDWSCPKQESSASPDVFPTSAMKTPRVNRNHSIKIDFLGEMLHLRLTAKGFHKFLRYTNSWDRSTWIWMSKVRKMTKQKRKLAWCLSFPFEASDRKPTGRTTHTVNRSHTLVTTSMPHSPWDQQHQGGSDAFWSQATISTNERRCFETGNLGKASTNIPKTNHIQSQQKCPVSNSQLSTMLPVCPASVEITPEGSNAQVMARNIFERWRNLFVYKWRIIIAPDIAVILWWKKTCKTD